jgi:hypothetical protein
MRLGGGGGKGSKVEEDEDDEEEEECAGVGLGELKTLATLGVGGFGRVNLVKHVDSDKVLHHRLLKLIIKMSL